MKRRRLLLISCGLMLLGWVVYAALGNWLAEKLAARFGAALVAAFQGKFSNPTVFVDHRLQEALWLLTLVHGWIGLHWFLQSWLQKRPRWQMGHWAIQALAGFICLNCWIGAASNTVIFWAAMGAGAGVQNQMQFNIKRLLLAEDPAPRRAVLVGSSQTRTQIDERRLNTLVGSQLWTYELHYPGSHAFDVWLVEKRLRRANPQWVICYVNEAYFYTGSYSEAAPSLLGISDVPDLLRWRAREHVPTEGIVAGLFGDLMPLFRCRQVLAQRLLGEFSANMKQAQYDAALQTDLDKRAIEMAPKFKPDSGSDFQKQAFEAFVAECQSAQRGVILLRGGFNPYLNRRIPPAVRTDLTNYLQKLKERYPVVTLIPESDLPQQLISDYDDLNHCNPDMQRRFTEALANILAKLPELSHAAP